MEKDSFTHLPTDIEEKYKINSELFNNKNFKEMTNYYLNYNDVLIYKRIDYLCNEEEICICNIYADDLRKMYDGINYKKNVKYISFYK